MTLPKPFLVEILKRRKDSIEKDTIEGKYNRLMNFLKDSIKGNGIVVRTYTYSFTTVPDWGGRLYSGNGIQGQPREIRGLLMRDTTDIDMKNAHPVILKYLCHDHGILCPNLDGYVQNREQILSSFPDRDIAKEMFLSSMNDNKLHRRDHSNKIFKRFDEEMKDIQTAFYNMEKYANIRKSIPADKAHNPQGSMLNRILCSWENEILQIALSVARDDGLDIAVPMFDGFMVYGNHYENTELLTSLAIACNKSFPGLNIEWTFKRHCMELNIPEGFVIPEDIEAKKALLASEKKRVNDEEISARIVEFEKRHCKIINADLYVIEQPEVNDKPIIFKTREKLQNAYSHMAHVKPDPNKSTTVPFVSFWINDNPSIRSYRDMNMYPNPSLCPPDMYNIWTPFSGESLPPAPENFEGVVDFIRNHIFILCGNDIETAKYMECWIAQMIQYPEVKSNCPILISKEGAGKGSFNTMCEKILGQSKVLSTTTSSRDVWGNFNGQLVNAFLVNLNEISKQNTFNSMDQIKGLITDPTLTINEKGIPSYKIVSYHRFLITTNKLDPMESKEDDRRFYIIRSSDELIGNKTYFNKFHTYLDNPLAVKSIYDYFKYHQGFGEGYSIEHFNSNPKPNTEYQQHIQEANMPPYIQWLIHFTEINPDKSDVLMLGKTTYRLFSQWCADNGVEYKTSSIKLGMVLINGTNGLVEKGLHTYKGNTKLFKLNMVRERYKLNNICPSTPAGFYDEEEDNTAFHGIA
jgi:hypothetical protein